jgi:Tol biopolymer transport system component
MRKTPVRRYQQVADINGPLIKLARDYASKAQPDGSRRSDPSNNLPWILAGAAVLALAAGGIFWFQSLSFKTNDPALTQITLDTGYDAEPSISSSARQVAYASDRSGEGNLDIWIQPVSSSAPIRLTRDPADDHEPSLAPDGATVAFRSERNPAGIYLVPASGGDSRLLVPEGRSPRFSPDGKWIAYWTSRSDAPSKVYAISPDGGQPRPIAPEFSAAYPVWSPDSRSMLFLGRKAGASSASDDDWWVASIDPGDPQNTGGCRALRQHAILRAEACPPPGDWKNKSVYFTLPDEHGSNIWQAEILPSRDITAKPVQVTSGDGIHAQPAATDEGKVLFSKQSLNVDIWGVPLRANEGKLGGQWKKLTTDPSTDVFPSLSANGTKLLFQSNRRGIRTAWVLDMNSRVETPILIERNELLWPRVSPDGSRLSFAQEAAAGYDRFVMQIAGGNPEPLCQGCGRGMDWSRDGKSALIEDTSSKSIVLVKPGSTVKIPVLQPRPGGTRAEPKYSPDQRSIAFVERSDSATSRIYLAGLHGESATPSVEWLPLTKDKAWEAAPQWSPDSRLVYFISNRDGYRCIWARHQEEVKTSTGEPFAVYHFHDTRLSPANTALDATDLFVGSGQIVISLGELSGSLWMLTPHQ